MNSRWWCWNCMSGVPLSHIKKIEDGWFGSGYCKPASASDDKSASTQENAQKCPQNDLGVSTHTESITDARKAGFCLSAGHPREREECKNRELARFCLRALHSDKLTRAVLFAIEHHGDQKDLGGEPYWFHPLTVANAIWGQSDVCSDREIEFCAAVLHDVVEDCGVTVDEIAAKFGDDVARLVERLTRNPGMYYEEYIGQVKKDPVAVAIKIADLEDNLDPRRIALAEHNGHDMTKRVDRYKGALKVLRGKK